MILTVHAARMYAIAVISAAAASLTPTGPTPAMTSASRSSIACSVIMAKTQAYDDVVRGLQNEGPRTQRNVSERAATEAVERGNAVTGSIKEIADRCTDGSVLNVFDAYYDVFRSYAEHSRAGDWQTALARAKRELERCAADYAATPPGMRCRALRNAVDEDERRWLASSAPVVPASPRPSTSP